MARVTKRDTRSGRPRGRLLVRPVAMLFDGHLREAQEEKRYSRVT